MNRSIRQFSPLTAQLRVSARARPTVASPVLQHLLIRSRGAASKSDDIKETAREVTHSTTGALQEVKAVTQDFASIIAGRSVQAAQAGGREQATAHGSVGADVAAGLSMFSEVPKPIMNFGLLGTVPYLGTAAATVALAREASIASSGGNTLSGLDLETCLSYLHTVEHVQIIYGATILSFLGALHWGMEFVGYGGSHGYKRLMLGTLPLLFAFPTTFLGHGLALATQWGAFTGTWMLDQRASTAGWTPAWFSTYRFYLSIIVGSSILFTLGGTGYYGAGSGAKASEGLPHERKRVSSMARLDRVKTRNEGSTHETKINKATGTVPGPIAAVENEDGAGYVTLHNVDKEEEEKKKEEEEKAKKAEAQDKKDEHQMDKSPDGMKAQAGDRTGANANEGKGEGDQSDGGKVERDQMGKPKENKGERSGQRPDPKNPHQEELSAKK